MKASFLCHLLHCLQPTETPDVLYFVLVDRFANGAYQNDWFVEPQNPQGFHGGDLQGVTQHLDHIQNLGADAIWLSPIFQMRTEDFHGHGAFHGYWTETLQTISPTVGGEMALEQLTTEMANKNMSLILDIVYNHTSFDAPLLNEHPDWFHPAKPIVDWNDPTELTTHQVHGLPDLDQSHPDVYHYLVDSSLKWLNYPSVIGLRVDAIRHMDNTFLSAINTDLDQQNGSTWLLGEDFQGNPIANIERMHETNIDALFDFPLYYALTNSLCDQHSLEEVASILSLDGHYPEDGTLVRFLDNHDLPRIYSRCHRDKQKVLTAEMLIFGVRGIPMISYGTETWSEGATEPANRQDMNWDNIDPLHSQHLATLSDFRKQHPVFKHGLPKILLANPDQLIVQQQMGKDLSLLMINRSQTELPIPSDICTKKVQGWRFEQTLHPITTTPTTLDPNQSLVMTCTGARQSSSVVTVTIAIEGNQEQQPMLVGSLPKFGGWNPQQGVQTRWNGEHWETTLTLPKDSVVSFKLVYESDNGFTWEQGNNRFLHSDTDKTFWIR